ncbi:MAG TPA: chromosome segregation protein SMC [Candidatus Limnocylindrales bacterium]|nr:chromosome segregation protein SMC [Candidatus Limnocylindrales bacterium]
MSAPARLLALRLHGFKSFAERTLVEFGGGISAVVGPNGSGKSNLADALRWALGEQGRALRSRKSEDVIFAGSEKRSAVGMADVTIVLDNADGLLPVDYSVLELGRRLYRSGENDYLLNKQRVRLKDLVDLLDAAHLADNAFLFIGQGMVDQALALRPEERRPLFEDVAGVRRHERRRRRAEEQLAESEGNLARVEDILAELRPQARRLAAQAEQQASRATAGHDLADALVLAAHARWHEAAGRAAEGEAHRAAAAAAADTAMESLRVAEEAAAALASDLAARTEAERARREAHDAARATLTALQVRAARLGGEIEAIGRDRARLADERAAAESDLVLQRRLLAKPVPTRDVALDAAVADADRALAEALSEVAALRAERQAHGEEAAALRRAAAAREAEAETARRRLADAERRAEAERAGRDASGAERARLEERAAAAREALEAATALEQAAAAEREAARSATDTAEAARQAAAEAAATVGSLLAAQRGRLEGLQAALAAEEARGIATAAKRRGGRRVDEDLVVDPKARQAIEGALDEATRAYLVSKDVVESLAGERGMLVVAGPSRPDPATRNGFTPAEARFVDAALAAGATRALDAIRRDPLGAATQLLRRVVVAADLESALGLQSSLPPGWVVVVRDGTAVVDESSVRLGGGDGTLERRAAADRLRSDVDRLASESEAAAAALATATAAADDARRRLEAARAAESQAVAERRAAEEADRAASRSLEAAVREAGWQSAQAERIAAEIARLRDDVAARDEQLTAAETVAQPPAGPGQEAAPAIASWEARAAELRTARDRLQSDQAAQDAVRREAEAARARAEAAVAIDTQRIERCDAESAALSGRETAIGAERDRTSVELAAAEQAEQAAATALAEVRAADADARQRLAAAEQAAQAERDRLRVAEDRLRAAERQDLEARLGRDSLREQLLVELAGLGELGIRRLEEAAGREPATAPHDDEAAALEAALAAVADRWAADAPPAEPPSQGRIASLRRRYHELGAASPFAVDEYAEVKSRLETLESQEQDLRQAIAKTRELIAELNRMIADQFATTFQALEAAFDARFRHLFGGGYAHLVMTDPDDLSSTGIEIVARPPGKKQQALAMLSGGERALTAVALLFAMLEVRPVPFCVLDEVDAALDEANVGRFTSALRELAAATQFIVITHNRGTIESADALYGVTVGDDSVSRVISLRLDEAQAIAEAHRNGSGELAEVG